MKKFISILMVTMLIVNTFALYISPMSASAASYEQTLRNKGFPESYIPALTELHEKYPNWVFEPLITGLDWQTAVNGERSSHGKQLIEKYSAYPNSYYCTCSNCYKNGNYVIREGSNWVAASETAVKYYMDPRNFLNEEGIFQFESTAYDGTQSKAGVEAILNGTWMYNSLITYKDGFGDTQKYDSTTKYSDAIMKAASDSGMSAYYLASKIRQENGGSSASATAVKGTAAPFQGIYNYYNIGANTGAYEGLAWAAGYLKTNKATTMYTKAVPTAANKVQSVASGTYLTWMWSYSNKYGDWYKVRIYYENGRNSFGTGKEGYILVDDIRTTYTGTGSAGWGRPWSNPYRSIYWGAKYIAKNFSTQTSGYLQKFNVSPKSSVLYNHEYMANVAAAASESKTTYKAYKSANILSLTKKFEIPVFKNMPTNSGWQKSDGTWYYYNSNGTLKTGWLYYKDNWYYLDPSTGAMQTGFYTVNGKTYYSEESGIMLTGWIKYGGNKWCYMDTSGAMVTGWQKIKDTKTGYNAWYCFKPNGEMAVGWYATKKDGARYNAYYYFAENGKMQTGWKDIDGGRYYLGTDGKMRNRWQKINDIWYYFGTDGKMTTGWQKVNEKWYYMDEDGKMQTGWIELKGKKYYLTSSGAMAEGSITLDGTVYIFNKSGALTKQYTLEEATAKLTSVSSPSVKTIKLSYTKPSVSVSGYEIMWSTTSDFSSNFLSKYATSADTLSYTLSTAQSNKVYYVKVRAYSGSSSARTYYPWSETKSVKVK